MTIGRSDAGAGARRRKHNPVTREPAGKFDSLIVAPVGRHAQKPTAFCRNDRDAAPASAAAGNVRPAAPCWLGGLGQ